MRTARFRLTLALGACITILMAACGAYAACSLTGDLDSDFVGNPGAIILSAADPPNNYGLSDAPLSQTGPGGQHLILPDFVIPSGFHVSRVAVIYDCASDTLCVGYDVSHETTFFGAGTGIVGRAWDADGDGDPCSIGNPGLDPANKFLLKDMVPPGGLTEKYQLMFDLNHDDIPDIILTSYDNGFPTNSDPCAQGFTGPCPNGKIWVTLLSSLGECLTAAPYNLGVNLIYGTDETHRDVEFSIQGYAAFAKAKGLDPCQPVLRVFADSDFDQSAECDLDFRTIQFSCQAEASITCLKTVAVKGAQPNPDNPGLLQICDLPKTVVFTLTATNNGSSPENIRITDPLLQVDESFPCVPAGESRQVVREVTYDFDTYCGHADIVNTMAAAAEIDGCVTCGAGTLTASCESTATVKFPRKVNANVSCRITADKDLRVCSFPTTINYTVTATNTGDAKEKITLLVKNGATTVFSDTNAGNCIDPNSTKQWTFAVTYDEAAYCGHDPVTYTATVSADADGCEDCICGNLTAQSTCDVTTTFARKVNANVSCEITADKDLRVCNFPTMINYTVTATNSGDVAEKITVVVKKGTDTIFADTNPGNCVAPNSTKQWTFSVAYDEAGYCGHDPITYTASVSADADGCEDCICGKLTAQSTCEVTTSFARKVNANVSCRITADKDLKVCDFPTTINYTVTATNSGDVAEKITVVVKNGETTIFSDANAGTCVNPNSTKQWTFAVAYDEATYCGHDPVTYIATVSADADGCEDCICGNLTAQSTCDVTTTFARKVNANVSCEITADKDLRVCAFPTTINYTVTATNSGDVAEKITVVVKKGNDTVFSDTNSGDCVAPNATKQWTFSVAYDEAGYCGHDPITYTATVSADTNGCAECVCGKLAAQSECDVTTTFARKVNSNVTCRITADKDLRVCDFPTTINYTITATNTGDVPEKISILVSDGSKEVFKDASPAECVPANETKQWTFSVTYDEPTYCGHDPVKYTAAVSAEVDGCAECVCGTLTSQSICDVTTTFARKVNACVSCTLTADKDPLEICSFPTTVNYTVTATNCGDVAEKITVVVLDDGSSVAFKDDNPGECVQPNQTKQWTFSVTYDKETYCGHDPVKYAATVSAAVDACAECVCGNPAAESKCDITARFAASAQPGVECVIFADKPLHISTFPTTITFTVRATNNGNVPEKITVSGDLVTDSTPGDCIPAGGTREWTVSKTFGPPDYYLGHPCETYRSTVTADLDDCVRCMCAGTNDAQSDCDITVCFEPPDFKLYQAYAGSSLGNEKHFAGKAGEFGDPIEAVPGIFQIIPGDKWSNYVSAAEQYDIKTVQLIKVHRNDWIQCGEIWNNRPTILQRGSDKIRLWWPLMYESPGTTWALEITWVGADSPEVHTETWTWQMHATLDTLQLLIKLFHELPWKTCEIPLISDEDLVGALLGKVDEIDQAWPNDPGGALDRLLEFENMVLDNCITVCPPSPMPRDRAGRLGITQTVENPACRKLIVDIEYIGFDMGIFTRSK